MSLRSNVSDEECVNAKVTRTPIQHFYENQTIFITGGTGFIGKVLIEKLSRSCSRISRIFVLIRKKKDKDPQDRLKRLFADPVFDKVRSSVTKFEEKITGIAGDISLENLGLNENDTILLKKNVSIVFHCAATVRFDEKLGNAAATNIKSTVTITNMCKDMKNLKAFVYVSTAYAHCLNNPTIKEEFYDYPVSYKELLLMVNSLSEENLDAIAPSLIKPWMNTYTCTKSLAENFLKTESENLPVAIFRPSIVIPSAFEPVPGWTDNFNGATGMSAGIISGVIRTMHCNPQKRANLVPVDFTVNALIACAWDVDRQVTRRGKNMLIYNFASASDVPVTWNMVREIGLKYNKKYPLNKALWYPSVRMCRFKLMNDFYKYLFHWIPAYIVDLLSQSVGQKPRMMKLYEKVHKMSDLLEYVTTNEWDVENDNVRNLWKKLDSVDRTIFQFTLQDCNWDEYFSTCIKGIRIYLFKDDLKTLNASRKKYMRLFLMDKVLQSAFLALVCYTLRNIALRRLQRLPSEVKCKTEKSSFIFTV